MPGRYCFLCASDEGVFLDITTDNRDTFVNQLETCLSSKVNESINLSNKICYKCAYELGQCTKFVQKYKKSHKTSKPEIKTSMPCCCLCSEHVENNRIFDITKDNHAIFNPLQKIRKIFNEGFKDDSDSKLICLPCRYNLDVLYDLKRIYQEAVIHLKALINEEIDYSNFPKVYTDVVNRKTTVTTFPDITFYDLINSDSENSENMVHNKPLAKNRRGRPRAQTKSQNDVKANARKCDKCHNIVPNGTDMYRFHRTRLTVCRNCWITMDPSKDKLKQRSQQVESNLAETKLCAVFLTDVLDKKSHKSEKEHKIEKNKDNKSYILSEDSSLEDRLSELSVNNAVNNNIKRGKKRHIDAEKNEDVESTPTKVTRLGTKRANPSETKVSSDVESTTYSTTTTSTRRGRKRTKTASDRSSDSDVSSPLKSKKKLDDCAKPLSPSSSKTDRKKLRTILQGVTANVHSQSTDESPTEDTNLETTKNTPNAHINKEKTTHKRTRSSSISNTEITSLAEFKSPKSIALSEVKKNCYTCDTCGKKFDTKLANIEHSLTHLMQASLKLERVTISSIKEKQDLKIDSEKDKVFKNAKICLIKTVPIDKPTNDPSEEIAINVVDTDEEEIFSSSREQSAKKKEAEKEASSERYNVTDKLNAESKLYVEESPKIQCDENMTEESEQCVESTAVPNETETSIEIEQGKDTKEINTKNNNIMEEDTKTKDRKASMDRDINTSIDKDTNVQKDAIVKDMSPSTSKFLYCYKLCTNVAVDENKDVSAENDTKMSTKEKEKSNNEANNDKEHLHEEMTQDSNATRPLVSSINNTTKDDDNKNHSESCKSDLKNSCKDNESEIIKDIEMRQCELTNKSQKENIDESEENEKIVLDITDETETLKDQIDLNDTVIVDEDKVEASGKQQDTASDQNMETEVIIDDKPNNATDTVKSDLLNGEKLNQAEDGDENENDVAIILADSNNDIVQYAKVAEETITIDSSKEKDKLEETIKNLEDLIENNTTNNKCEERENSNHTLNDSSMDAANMILKEVFDLAAAEVQKREDINNTKDLQNTEIETLENITREIRNSADMPSLDPISIMDIDDDNDITLN
ncbi:reticulocyte-binding protein 2-like isoform X1 [Formica exsecta]|uniref:reticulocyte-binding protein 2-like isoform X1 n=2 Tax=Formica exsecta TaxID=72781 RepID=UPI0011433694|nr:reticulocyte-binding protein 2-like isoform X1 [Formica exsecta]